MHKNKQFLILNTILMMNLLKVSICREIGQIDAVFVLDIEKTICFCILTISTLLYFRLWFEVRSLAVEKACIRNLILSKIKLQKDIGWDFARARL